MVVANTQSISSLHLHLLIYYEYHKSKQILIFITFGIDWLTFPLQTQIIQNMLIPSPSFKAIILNNCPKQNPLYFTNTPIDIISKTLTAFGSNHTERIIYMGQRYPSTLKLFRAFSTSESRTNNKVSDCQIYGEEQVLKYSYLNNDKQKYYPVRSSQYRLFTGVNPTAKKDELRFDSNFECGNLDLVVALGDKQYDLFLRVDSNTRGHTCWFFFKVENFVDQQKVKFNLPNFSRSELSYQCGMGIYVFTSSGKQWIQSGSNVQFFQGHKCRYVDQQTAEQLGHLHTLSFEYQFKIEDQFVYFAYCIPYSYSFLQFKIDEIEKKYSKIVEVDRTNLSTGGLAIPILTITNKSVELEPSKDTCLIIARLHPGETQGSWLMHGFLNYLCSAKAKELRSKLIFKVIPMVNVDGVVAGNFRTNLLGRDLNRNFHHPQTIPEIGLIRSLATKYKPFMFLDFHGHSSRKNIFTYGPDYSIDNRYFLPSRIFPKLVSRYTKSFRYYSCNFRITEDKSNTGRAVMLRNHQIIYCFTVEASAYAYGSRKEEILFDKSEYIQSGSMVCAGLDKFINIIFAIPKRHELSLALSIQKMKQKTKSSKISPNHSILDELDTSQENKKLLQQILKDERQKQSEYQRNSVGINDSDFEQNNDYSEKELCKMLSDSEILHLHKKNKKFKKQKLLVNKSYQNHSLHAESNTKIPPKHKLSEAQQVVSDYSQKKKKVLNIMNNDSPQLLKDYSDSMKLQREEFYSPGKQKKMKIEGKHLRRLFSQESCIIIDNQNRIQNLNHLSLDFSVNKTSSQYEPLSEAKRVKDKVGILVKRRNKGRQEYILTEQSEKEKKQGLSQIKRSLLPTLGKSNMKKEEKASIIEQIFEKREISRRNRLNRHIKILYF